MNTDKDPSVALTGYLQVSIKEYQDLKAQGLLMEVKEIKETLQAHTTSIVELLEGLRLPREMAVNHPEGCLDCNAVDAYNASLQDAISAITTKDPNKT